MTTITAIVIAKNEEAMLANCLETLKWCDEVLVVDHYSADATVGIAERAGARVVQAEGSFAQLRNEGLARSKTDWLLYIDADERVTPSLADEIKTVMHDTTHAAYSVGRNNILYGHVLAHGGWQNDRVVRLFQRAALKKWAGEVHEHAEIEGTTGELKEALVHLTHRSVASSLMKSREWTPIEAHLLFEAGIPAVTGKTLIRKAVMEAWRRIIVKGGYRDGVVGWVEGLTQAMNRLLVYMQVWELQQKPPIADRYQRYEQSIADLWKKQS